MLIEIFEKKAKLAFLGRTRVGELPVSFRDGVTIGPNSAELSSLAGRLGRDANMLPFHFLKWPLVDIEYKDRVMMEIKQYFDFPDECNKYVLKQLNAAWKDEKTDLKREYFIPFATREDRIANRLDKVPKDQWTVLVEYWENPKTLEKVGKNILNRKRPKIMHTGGSKSFMKHAVEIEEDPELDAPLGTPTTLLKIFRKTHTRKDKTPINELDKEKMDQMKELADKATEDGSSMYSTEHDDIFTQVMGPDSRGRGINPGHAGRVGPHLMKPDNAGPHLMKPGNGPRSKKPAPPWVAGRVSPAHEILSQARLTRWPIRVEPIWAAVRPDCCRAAVAAAGAAATAGKCDSCCHIFPLKWQRLSAIF
ncbi:Plant transposase (Ptta/En/Spm family) [Abeliophyllum distichum]|uniref:Plant transposase (Ptta/En/Spm family) n=1 Tax=Abeliophyllum distichum TaxID=126358 RepID=A0ABD1RH49_9LAMI